MKPAILSCILGVACILTLATTPNARAQRMQVPDTAYEVANPAPAFTGTGPKILVSTEHSAFVANGSYLPFAKLAKSDGFAVEVQNGALADALGQEVSILVIINAYLKSFPDHPAIDPPSAFSDDEIGLIRQWVEDGGSLLLLADHAPLGGGASKLAAAFDFTFLNGYAGETRYVDANVQKFDLDFRPANGLNTDHPITNGGTGRQSISRFHAFGGQAFIPPSEATTLLRIPDGWSIVFTFKPREELASAPRIDAAGMAQGAVRDFGKGRVAVFADAGGFSAQIMKGLDRNLGFNTPEGAENPEFILSVLRWLARYQPSE